MVGKTSGYIELKAPFDGIIKKVYTVNSNVVWLESLEKVKFANGIEDYMTIMTMHDDNVSDLYVGKIIKQGIVYYRGGTAGNTTGPHIHLEVARGKFTNTGWYKNQYGKWNIYNNIRANDALFLPENCEIIYDYGYAWKKDDEEIITSSVERLQKALNNSYGSNLISGIYDSATTKVIAKNNLKYKSPTMKNDFVKWVQNQLNLNGYNLDIDGSYGKLSRNAIINFQQNNNLKTDGIVGNSTVKKLLEL